MKKQRIYYGRNMNTGVVIDKEFEAFTEAQVLQYHESNLENVNADFAFVLKEYRDGLLLFDLMEKQVWNAATKDSVGLAQFYEANKTNYQWKDRADAVILTSASKSVIGNVQEKLKNATPVEEILNELNVNGKQNVISTANVFEKGDTSLPDNFQFKEGVSDVLSHNDAYHVLLVKEVIPSGLKSMEEARGRVVSDYQTYLENEWIKSLSERFEIKRNPSVLKRVKEQIQGL
ncbi:MAG: peptidyl-prolyl cis-trans isomerase, partial [Psychroserpens sp.]|nr:peptidyl-prolyl cis-trans isomerase [Psychroserpens sp.]